MKKIFTITSIAALAIVIAFACKKSTTNSTSTTSTSSTTGSTTSAPTNTTTTNYSVNGVAITPTSTVYATGTGSNYYVFADNRYPGIELSFPFTASFPPSGTYSIITTAPNTNQCNFYYVLSGSTSILATSGVVTVVAAPSPNNTAYFTNILATSGSTTYTISGALKY